VDNGAMMESPDEENRQRREPFFISARADVGRERHLADVELFSSHHAAKGIDERFDLFEIEFERLRSNGPVLQGMIISLRSKYRFQFKFGDGILLRFIRRRAGFGGGSTKRSHAANGD
jgi:hypothetical protein